MFSNKLKLIGFFVFLILIGFANSTLAVYQSALSSDTLSVNYDIDDESDSDAESDDESDDEDYDDEDEDY